MVYRSYNKGDISKILWVNNPDGTRNNRFKLEKFWFTGEMGRNQFSNRVVDEWNRLSNHTLSTQRIGSFKRRSDKFVGDRWN